MKQIFSAWALVLAVLLLLPQLFAVCAAESGADMLDSAGDSAVDSGGAESLRQFLREDRGGTFRLTGDIIIEGGYRQNWFQVSRPAVVELGDYGIRIPGGSFFGLAGPVRFVGQGTAAPLFKAEGELELLSGVEVIAEGAGAAAVESTGKLNLEACLISAQGEGSVGLRADDLVELKLCAVTGGGASVEAPEVVLDACTAAPEPRGAKVIRREAAVYRTVRLYGAYFPVNSSQEEYSAWTANQLQNAVIAYAMISREGEDVYDYLARTRWTGIPEQMPPAGQYKITVTPVGVPSWLPVKIPEFEFPLRVFDPSKPFLTEGRSRGDYVELCYPVSLQEAQSAALFYSVDKGITWRDAGELGVVKYGQSDVVAGPLEPETDYYFRVEMEGGLTYGGVPIAGMSNTLWYPNYKSDLDIDYSSGGDQDGGDRGDQGEELPPAQVIPPEEPQLPASAETGRGGGNSGGAGTQSLTHRRDGAGSGLLAARKEAPEARLEKPDTLSNAPTDTLSDTPTDTLSGTPPREPARETPSASDDMARTETSADSALDWNAVEPMEKPAGHAIQPQAAEKEAVARTSGEQAPALKAMLWTGGAVLAAGGILWRRKRRGGR